MLWEFAQGLQVSGDLRTVLKPLSERGLVPSIVGSHQTLSSTHAFSARLIPPPNTAGKGGEGEGKQASSWRQRFTLHSQSPSPSVLVGAAAITSSVEGEPQEAFDRRVLGTPMLWEEPHAYFLECRANGGFLWSETAQIFGQRVFAQCFTANGRSAGGGEEEENAALHAVVDVEYSVKAEGLDRAGKGRVTFRVGEEVATLDVPWLGHEEHDELLPPRIFPHVTLMEAGDSATATAAQ